jgi:hypothetical protein
MEMRRKLVPTGICGRVRHIDTPFGKLVVDRLALGRGADHGHLAPTAGNQLTDSLHDPGVVSLGEHDPTANGHSPSF